MTTLIIGASSWVGAYLAPALCRQGAHVLGTFHNTPPRWLHGIIQPIQYDVRDTTSLNTLIGDVRPDTIVNLLQNDDAELLQYVNQQLVEKIRGTSLYYVFLSSALAFDADLSHPHHEYDEPKGAGAYGACKAICECAIRSADISHLIIRIAAIHGYAPNKTSRTERFLQRLMNGDLMQVDAGVVQNRLSVQRMADALATLIAVRAIGTFHLGTEDASTESSFLRHLALAFGYDSQQIIENPSPVRNLVVLPGKAYEILGPDFRSTEADTITDIKQTPQFARYLKS